MKIHVPNSTLASGPAFSLDVTIPNSNLPVYIIDYSVRSSDGCNLLPSTQNSHLVSMKPSSKTTRVLQFQARFVLSQRCSEYSILYTFDPYDDLFRTYAPSIVYAPFPSGTFSIQDDPAMYNVSDYWTYDVLDPFHIQLTFQPSVAMMTTLENRIVSYDIVL